MTLSQGLFHNIHFAFSKIIVISNISKLQLVCVLFSGQGSGNQETPPPQIKDFLAEDLIKPDEVKFSKVYDSANNQGFKLPCTATDIKDTLQWRWQHNGSDIVFGGKYTLQGDGSLKGEYLEAENSGNYQCFLKDTNTGKETFSRKLQVAVTC